ncbi:hypothetical protein PBI_SUFFOLK_70 [Mycobacterium phage Suffolk]|uniref:Uncharacterized protein n=1 Tax=Mycobacterium phage Suffolk TaxID=1414748 RepID=V5UQ94_9CAUD|nr:hypothetical protein PBI_SUFFOLK_70 [Mycobacterium phage Suffolk]AHB79706.1 hypothetical protein PBI_SUFFOLK_70 [Mycobacterium phage Suffolk]
MSDDLDRQRLWNNGHTDDEVIEGTGEVFDATVLYGQTDDVDEHLADAVKTGQLPGDPAAVAARDERTFLASMRDSTDVTLRTLGVLGVWLLDNGVTHPHRGARALLAELAQYDLQTVIGADLDTFIREIQRLRDERGGTA